MSLKIITQISREYGADPRLVLAGGGNTSFKDKTHLYVKPSGIELANITKNDFIKMNRRQVRKIFEFAPGKDVNAREAKAKELAAAAVCPGSTGRPSVEAPLHELMPFKFVVHLHPALINGLTCSKNGQAQCAKLFPEAMWVDYVDPGFTLAKHIHDALAKFVEKEGRQPKVIMIQNHGVFVGANTDREIRKIYNRMMATMTKCYRAKKVSIKLEESPADPETAQVLMPQLRSWLGDETVRMTINHAGKFAIAKGPFSPDHIVYAKSYGLVSAKPDSKAIAKFKGKHGYQPLVINVPRKGVFCAGKNYKEAVTVTALARDAALVQQLTQAFGGPNYLSKRNREFIENWEVESYRKKVASGGKAGRLQSRIAVVTGGAQGFGFGIARGLAAEAATVVIADLNLEGAEQAAAELNQEFGRNRAFALKVNIAKENSVADMISQLIYRCGGLDLLVANAGVLKAGSVKDFDNKDWDFVTSINYTGYFLCVKHVAKVMAKQNAAGGGWTDIVQINSKSGLEGSNRNAAYAGSKFGTIGLTQSFAMELIDDKIKVNSICPGNFFEGPLWSDPKNGLFVQYLRSKKVPGAKSLEDVKKFYESKVPMNRGCTPDDVVKAILYAVEQQYETGQAIPVTGGQVMLN